MTSSNGTIFRVTGLLCGEFTGDTKASDAELFDFFICTWTNGWVNNRHVGDLRRHSTLYDVTVMTVCLLTDIAIPSCRDDRHYPCVISNEGKLIHSVCVPPFAWLFQFSSAQWKNLLYTWWYSYSVVFKYYLGNITSNIDNLVKPGLPNLIVSFVSQNQLLRYCAIHT